MIKERLCRNVKKACKERDTTVDRMEKELRIPQGSINKWKKNAPSIERVYEVSKYLDVTIDKLIERSERNE